MHVVFVGQSGSSAGGAERSMQLLLSHLPERIAFTVVLFEDGAYADELRGRGFAVEVVPLDSGVMGVQRERLPISAAAGSVAMVRRLISAFRRLAPDVVYTNTVKAHVLGTIAARLGGFRSAMHLRDILDGRGRDVLRVVARTCAKRRIAISHAVANALAVPPTEVVPNPLDLAEYERLPAREAARDELGLPRDVPIVGIIGRINRWKGHDRFLRSMAFVATHSGAHFAIVGKPMFRDADFVGELETLAASLGIGARVHFVPWLEDPRVAYAAFDVNCNASHEEPFGRTIIEAAACGVPTVCYAEGGAPEAVADRESGLVVAAGDERAFGGAVLELLLADRDAVARRCRAHARTFDAGLHAERIAAILDGMVGKNGHV